MENEIDFDQWFDLFLDHCKSLGYYGRIDRETFEVDYYND